MFHCLVGVWVIEQRAIMLSATVRSPTVIYQLKRTGVRSETKTCMVKYFMTWKTCSNAESVSMVYRRSNNGPMINPPNVQGGSNMALSRVVLQMSHIDKKNLHVRGGHI